MRGMAATAVAPSRGMVFRLVQRFPDAAERRRVGAQSADAATTQHRGCSCSIADRACKDLRHPAMAIARGRSSAQNARGSALHHVLAWLQESSKHHRCSPAPFHGSGPVAVALHRAAAARPRPSDPARTCRGRGTRSGVRSAACATHGSDARTDAPASHIVARLVEMRGAVMTALRNTFTTISREEPEQTLS